MTDTTVPPLVPTHLEARRAQARGLPVTTRTIARWARLGKIRGAQRNRLTERFLVPEGCAEAMFERLGSLTESH
jgi:hypothetical protein